MEKVKDDTETQKFTIESPIHELQPQEDGIFLTRNGKPLICPFVPPFNKVVTRPGFITDVNVEKQFTFCADYCPHFNIQKRLGKEIIVKLTCGNGNEINIQNGVGN